MTTHRPPARSLGPTPELASRDDVALALEWLSFVRSEARMIEAACEADVRPIKERHERQMFVDVGGERLPFTAYAALLNAAVLRYVGEHRDEVFTDPKSKTARFTHGEVAARKQPRRVEFLEGHSAETLVEAVKVKVGWFAKAAALLKKLQVFGRPLGLLFDVELTIAKKTRVLEQVERGELTEKDLARAGLRLAGGEDAVSIKPAEYFVAAQPDRAAA